MRPIYISWGEKDGSCFHGHSKFRIAQECVKDTDRQIYCVRNRRDVWLVSSDGPGDRVPITEALPEEKVVVPRVQEA